MVERVAAALAQLPNEPFARPSLAYRPGGPIEEMPLRLALEAGRSADRAARRTLAGPHRDELEVAMSRSRMPAAACSTGEQKAMLIAITLAHAELAARDRPSVLLLDEVAAHLDPVRRAALFERLAQGQAQVWMTGTETAPFEAILATSTGWSVAAGKVAQFG